MIENIRPVTSGFALMARVRLWESPHDPQIAGKILRVQLPEIFSTAKTGDIVATICCANAERNFSAPISGTVLEVNGSLKANPELLFSDPYAEGWLFRLRIEAGEELEHLLAVNLYREQMRSRKPSMRKPHSEYYSIVADRAAAL